MTQLADRPIIQKYEYIRSQAIKQSANGESCAFRSDVCNGRNDTVVWCHSNFSFHGKGGKIKASDIYGFYGCSACHEWFDRCKGNAEDRRNLFLRAHAASLNRLIEKGIVTVKP